MTQTRCSSDAAAAVVELRFAAGLPGYANAHGFVLSGWGGPDSPFLLMSSTDDPDLRFVVISPNVFHPDYEFDVDDDVAARLDLDDPAEVVVLCIVTLHDSPVDATVNLMGPIVVNGSTGEACQAVQSRSTYEARALLTQAA